MKTTDTSAGSFPPPAADAEGYITFGAVSGKVHKDILDDESFTDDCVAGLMTDSVRHAMLRLVKEYRNG